MAADMIESVDLEDEKTSSVVVPEVNTTENLIDIASISCNAKIIRTKEILSVHKQIRCIWCSRVHLITRKTTMRCLYCNRGFCRDQGRACWPHHVDE